MVITETLISAVILAAGAVFGGTIYIVMNEAGRSEKKEVLEELLSQLINLLLFIYIIKIILNLEIFLDDPLAVLAYPSNSMTFYAAIVLTALMIIYKNFKGKMDLSRFSEALVIVFLASSMMYEFIYFIIYDDAYAFGYFIVLAVIFLVFYMLYSRVEKRTLLIGAVLVWSAGIIGLSAVYSTATVFDYTMQPWFVAVLAAGSILLILSAYGKTEEKEVE